MLRPLDARRLTRVFAPALAVALAIAPCAGCSGGGAPSGGGGGGGGGNGNVPQEILDLEVDTHDGINFERQQNAVPPLTMDPDLRAVARAHSQDMVDRDFFSHVNPDGLDPFDRMLNAGITYLSAGENIAYVYGYPDPVATAIAGWMQSPGHRQNILNPSFTHTGLGIAEKAPGEYYLTQVFASFTGNLVVSSLVIDERGAPSGGSDADNGIEIGPSWTFGGR